MDVVVTGGAGFIGTKLITALRESGRFRHVVSLDSVAGDNTDIVADITRPLVGLDTHHRETGDQYQFSLCFHLAGIAKEPGFPDATYFAVNDIGTGHVLDWCDASGINSVIFTSTMMVFGAGETRFCETDALSPDTAYGASKALAEERLRTWLAQGPGRRIRVVRPGVVFGPGDSGNFVRLRAILRRRMFFYVGRRTTVKSCIHIDDMVSFLVYLCGVGDGDVFHCAFPEEVRIEDVVEGIFDAFGGRYRVPTVPYRFARLASRPFEALAALGLETGIHRRRIDKLYRSTNISAEAMIGSGYKLQYPSVKDALRAWARHEFDYRDPQAGLAAADQE